MLRRECARERVASHSRDVAYISGVSGVSDDHECVELALMDPLQSADTYYVRSKTTIRVTPPPPILATCSSRTTSTYLVASLEVAAHHKRSKRRIRLHWPDLRSAIVRTRTVQIVDTDGSIAHANQFTVNDQARRFSTRPACPRQLSMFCERGEDGRVLSRPCLHPWTKTAGPALTGRASFSISHKPASHELWLFAA
ncbi:hypothetical protein ONZ51_g2419 [Trametes cubensis]|uniref:Uncharacterized protein n=1 Tax=Trametes cubensis TaxID=1111947 RepID=A0AAD7U0C9_9APHY|nr:hypothetical protein ONZ51_g2419 [Trametes cubensis]